MSIKVFGISRPDGMFHQKSGGWGPPETMEVFNTTGKARLRITNYIQHYANLSAGIGWAGAFLVEFELAPTGTNLPHIRHKGGR